jgi:hypothetical protein
MLQVGQCTALCAAVVTARDGAPPRQGRRRSKRTRYIAQDTAHTQHIVLSTPRHSRHTTPELYTTHSHTPSRTVFYTYIIYNRAIILITVYRAYLRYIRIYVYHMICYLNV